MRGDKEQCLQAGCKDYIAKPILISELIRVLRRDKHEQEVNRQHPSKRRKRD